LHWTDVAQHEVQPPAVVGRQPVNTTSQGMVLNQARPAFEAWFGVLPDITPELRRMIEATL